MAYLRKRRVGRATYYYVLKTARRGDKVVQTVCEYLGRDPDPKRLKRALEYWGVKVKPGKGKGR